MFLSFVISSQTYFQYDLNGNQISASYDGNNPCIDEPTSSNDISLEENYKAQIEVFPNPFNERFTVSLEIERAGNYNLTVYNLLGEVIARPIQNGWLKIGNHSIEVIFSNNSTVFIVQLSDRYGYCSKKIISQIEP